MSASLAKQADTDGDRAVEITPRDLRFGRGEDFRQKRWWLNGDPVASAFHNALSVTFPKGEAFFIETLKQFRGEVSPKLDREIRAFCQQEVMHGREHLAFNKRVSDSGYDISRLEATIGEAMDQTRERPQIINVAATMALEHFTAIMSAHILRTGASQLKGADPELVALWVWHAIEEVEHKAVAFDVYLHATKGWPRWKRWWLKTKVMLITTWLFWKKRTAGILDLLEQDGISGWRAKARVFWYYFGRPGILRRAFPKWLVYFKPGFHPWDNDDRELIQLAESEYIDAVLPDRRPAAA